MMLLKSKEKMMEIVCGRRPVLVKMKVHVLQRY